MTDESSSGPGRKSPSEQGENVADVAVLQRTPVDSDALISIETSDVTAWCPYEGTADYYTVRLEYWPDEYAVELMSLRDYFQTFRSEKIGHEEFASRVYDDFLTVLDPGWLRLVVDAPPRYGLNMTLRHQTGPKPPRLQETAAVETERSAGSRNQ